MHYFVKLAAIFSAVSLVGCASAPKAGSPEAAALQEKKQEEQKTKAVSRAISNVPDWYLNPPAAANAIYTAGEATSGSMQFAIDRAVLSAKFSLATQLNSRVSGMIKDYMRDAGVTGDARLEAEAIRVSQNVVTEVNVAGYRREKSEVFQEGNSYRAYVLLNYPVGEANRIVRDQVRKSTELESRLRASKAFQDLEKEIEAARSR
jgi:hypothetical protein